MHPTFAFSHHRESQLSSLSLSDSESTGGIESSYFADRRRHMLPHDWPSPLLRFMAPTRRCSASSASRPYPRSGSDPQAA